MAIINEKNKTTIPPIIPIKASSKFTLLLVNSGKAKEITIQVKLLKYRLPKLQFSFSQSPYFINFTIQLYPIF